MLEELRQIIRDFPSCEDFAENEVDELATLIYQRVAEKLDISKWDQQPCPIEFQQVQDNFWSINRE